MGKVKFTVNNVEYDANVGESVIDALRRAGVGVYAPCGGAGKCGKCKIRATGALSPLDGVESAKLSEVEKRSDIRLCCRAEILGDVEAFTVNGSVEILTGGTLEKIELSPIRKGGMGIAVDVGTTTVAVYACDMQTGKLYLPASFSNPQSSYGGDVISRIDKIMRFPSALAEQKKIITDAINSAVKGICANLYKSIKDVRACVICGNTVMQSIAANINPASIAQAPFAAPTLFENACFDASSLGFEFADDAVCMFAPCVSSYVGGDVSCGVVSAQIDRAAQNVLYVDVGTNGETVLVCNGKSYACSAAAGPALEGAGIECGMAGASGAICRVEYDGDIRIKTIGDAAPRGICGSGLIDIAALMLREKIIDETGAFCGDYAGRFSKNIGKVDNKNAFFITEHVYISELDIRKIQLAKAAICAGIYTLCNEAGICVSDVSNLILAGGFGSNISADGACEIGLVPRELRDRISFAGNAAGMGAVALLLDENARSRAAAFCENTRYIELSSSASFMEKYIEQMSFYSDDV